MSKSDFLTALQQYQSLPTFDISTNINALDGALIAYASNPTDMNRSALQSTFAPIASYYSSLSDINSRLQEYINSSAKDLASSTAVSLNQERYNNRVHPEESVVSREVMMGIFPALRMSSIPYIIAVSVFMASLCIFLIFQMFGFSGQLNVPTSVLSLFNSPATAIPFYQNPMFLGGVSVVLLVTVVITGILYFKSKNTNR